MKVYVDGCSVDIGWMDGCGMVSKSLSMCSGEVFHPTRLTGDRITEGSANLDLVPKQQEIGGCTH